MCPFINQMISAVLIFTESGLLLYSMIPEKEVDPIHFSGFLSALKSFAKSNIVNGELRGVQIGKALLTFQNIDFDHFGSLDVMLLSESLDPASAYALCSTIAEKFAIYLDEKYQQNKHIIKEINKGKRQDFRDFDEIISPLILEYRMQEGACIDTKLFIPNKVFDTINVLFEERPEIAEKYNQNPNFLIEQILLEFAKEHLEEKIRKKFLF